MPLIEELPTTTTVRVTHGWAYVPDTRPLKSALPAGGRKRAPARDVGGVKDLTARQQKATQSRLAELEKENHKDAIIPIPQRARERGALFRTLRYIPLAPTDMSNPFEGKSKMTPNVRRILGYQRTFAHYLADEEAQPALSAHSAPAPSTSVDRPNSSRSSATTTTNAAHIRPASRQMSMQAPPHSSTSEAVFGMTPTTPILKMERANEMLPPPSPCASQAQKPSSSVGATVDQLVDDPALDSHPLLKSKALKMPSARLMEKLLSEPPLSYNAARAAPTHDARPRRYFCAICGYWGKVKCRKCGERTCGLLDCWRAHEPQCTLY